MKHLHLLLFCLISIGCIAQPKLEVTVSNPLGIDRNRETVEIAYVALQEKLPLTDNYTYIVLKNGKEIPSQLVFEGKDTPQQFIFQVDIKANGTENFTITSRRNPVTYPSKVHGRFAPERSDDYFWENDLIAFRIYGPALLAKDGPSNGLDVFVKHTDQLFMDKIYKDYIEHKINYHIDHGLGVDCYKVGRTLGCGAMAPFVNGKLWLGQNFAGHRALDNGPIRTTVELTYETLDVDGVPVIETRIFSLDAGSQLNKVTNIFDGFTSTVPVAAGITLKTPRGFPVGINGTGREDPNHQPILVPEKGYIIYSEEGDRAKPDHDNGIIYTAVVSGRALSAARVEQGHVLAIFNYEPGSPLTYYTGAGWSKRIFDTPEKWQEYVSAFAEKLRQPLQVNFR